MKKPNKKKLRRAGSRAGKSEANVTNMEPPWFPVKHRVNQADVDRAAERSDVEKAAINVDHLRRRVTELRQDQAQLETRLQEVRADLSTAILFHVEATQKFKDMTALQVQIS